MAKVSLSTRDNVRCHFRVLVASYAVSLPKAEDLFSAKRGPRTFHPCHICVDSKENLPGSKKDTASNLIESAEPRDMSSILHKREKKLKIEIQTFFIHIFLSF